VELLIAMIVIGFVIGCSLYRAYVYVCCPERWAAKQRMKHEKEMAAAEARKARNDRIANSVLGKAAKAVIGAAIKNRPPQ
jgi:hypothetical protein